MSLEYKDIQELRGYVKQVSGRKKMNTRYGKDRVLRNLVIQLEDTRRYVTIAFWGLRIELLNYTRLNSYVSVEVTIKQGSSGQTYYNGISIKPQNRRI